MTIRSGLHVAGSPPAGRGGGKMGHASISWLLFHMAKAIPHFSEACFKWRLRSPIKLGLVSIFRFHTRRSPARGCRVASRLRAALRSILTVAINAIWSVSSPN
jgi:hypothetical protein